MPHTVKGRLNISGLTIEVDIEIDPGLIAATIRQLAEGGAQAPVLPKLQPAAAPGTIVETTRRQDRPTTIRQLMEEGTPAPSSDNGDTERNISTRSRTTTSAGTVESGRKSASTNHESPHERIRRIAREEGVKLVANAWAEKIRREEDQSEEGLRVYFRAKHRSKQAEAILISRGMQGNQYSRTKMWELAQQPSLSVEEIVEEILRTPQDTTTSTEDMLALRPATTSANPREAAQSAHLAVDTVDPRQMADSISLLAGLTPRDLERLEAHNIRTLDDLRKLDFPTLRDIYNNYWVGADRVRKAAAQLGINLEGETRQNRAERSPDSGEYEGSISTEADVEVDLDNQDPIDRLSRDGLLPAFAMRSLRTEE